MYFCALKYFYLPETSSYLPIALISFFLAAFLFSLLINGLFVKFSKTLGIRNHPETQIRWSNSSKPSLGGISFYIIFLLSLAAGSFIYQQSENFRNITLLGLVASASLAFLMGLFDDAYNTKVWLKLLTQISCGAILVSTGSSIQLFGDAWLNDILTVLWVIAMMNSVNMLDNMDGITSIISLFTFIPLTCILLTSGFFTSPYLLTLIGLMAALAGFLFFNWHPSKLYMGDTGSQFLGLVLAFFGVQFLWNAPLGDALLPAGQRLLLVLTIFALPITDTTTVVIKRLMRKTSPFVGGKDHTTHHLSYLGLNDAWVAIIFALISLGSASLVLMIYYLPVWHTFYNLMFGTWFLAVFVTLFIIANRNTKL